MALFCRLYNKLQDFRKNHHRIAKQCGKNLCKTDKKKKRRFLDCLQMEKP